MAYATPETIRDRVYTLIEGITPASLAADKFRRYRNEGDANFVEWTETQPAGAFRRFQVRDSGEDEIPEVSNTDFDDRRLTLNITIAYPQNARAGANQAMDRDDVMDSDYRKIDYLIGIYGRANFSSTHDCTPLGTTKARESGENCDYLIITAQYRYFRQTPT